MFHQVSSGVLQSSLFFENTSAQMIKMPSVWHPQASSSILQPCRDTRHNPCDYKSNTRFHSFSCYLSPLKIEGRTLPYLFYTIKKSICFFYFYFPFFLFHFFQFFIICSSIYSMGVAHCASNDVFIEPFTP
jgi:hypothetical protein